MTTYYKDYSIEWREKCEADSFEEAERILDEQAQKACSDTVFIADLYFGADVEREGGD